MTDKYTMKYEARMEKAANNAARKLFDVMSRKKTNLIFSDDITDPEKMLRLADLLGPEIAVLKTHIDLVDYFTPELTKRLVGLSEKHDFMIFEDRKFADIGNTVKMQYTHGVYRIAEWSNFVNVNVLPGPGPIKGIGEVMSGIKDSIARGIIILAQMSSEGNLATGEYTEKAVEFSNQNREFVAGYIGNGSDAAELKKLAKIALPGHVIMTPGIKIDGGSDGIGQRYCSPEGAVLAGSDCIIVGRGIYGAGSPLEAAKEYRRRGWEAYLTKTKSE